MVINRETNSLNDCEPDVASGATPHVVGGDEDLVGVAAGPRPGRVASHVLILAICALVIVASAALSLRPDSQSLASPLGGELPSLCWSRSLFNVECPGCGMTRAFVAIAHGDFSAAWRYNPASFAWFVAVAWQIPWRMFLIHQARKGREPAWLGAAAATTWTVLIAACLLQWLVRLMM